MEKSFVHHHDKHQGRLATTSEGDYDYAKSDDNELLNIANFWCFSGNPWSCLRVQKIDRGSQQPGIRPLWLLSPAAGRRQPLFPAVARFAKFKLPSSRPDSGPGAESYMRTVASWGWGQRRGQREDNAGLWLVATDHVTCTLTWDWSIAGDGRELSDGRPQQRLHLRHLRRGLLRVRGNLLLPDLPPGDARSDGLRLGLLQVLLVTQKCGGKIYLSSHLKWITLPDRIRISMWIWWKTWSWLHVEFRDRNPNSVWMCKFTIRSFVNTDSSVATRLWCY